MKLPEPNISARCGVCFSKMIWSTDQCEFECPDCLIKAKAVEENGKTVFKTVYQSDLQVPCSQFPPKSVEQQRYLRRNSEGRRVFRTYTFVFSPCSLPNGHTSTHYFPHHTTYTEDVINTGSIPVINEDPLAPPEPLG
jgi:hypothetical protein